jgi:lysophospholipid acyltransferase
MPWIGFIFLMGHMSISHIHRQILDDAQTVDITGAQMVLVMKLSSFCWNVHDGRLPQDQLSDSQKYSAITEFPSIVNFAGYVLFFPSLFAGPSFEYVDYRRWLDTSLFDIPPGTDPSKVPPTKKKRKIPRSGTPALKKAVVGLGWIFLFLQLAPRYTTDFVLSDSFMDYAFPRRIWIVYMVGFATRLKYYGVWSLTEGACILSGMGYNGFDGKSGKVFWNRLENVDPWALETAQNSHGYLGSWNKNTNHWLRNYVYLRVTPKGKKPGFRASMATFATSALWHGFYPGYYLTFVLGSFIQTAAKSMFNLPSFFHPYANSMIRLPPLRPTLLPHPGRHQAHAIQAVLRHCQLVRHASHTGLHRPALRPAQLRRFHGRVVPRLFLRHRRHPLLDRLLRLPRKGLFDRSNQASQPTPCHAIYQHGGHPADHSGFAQ